MIPKPRRHCGRAANCTRGHRQRRCEWVSAGDRPHQRCDQDRGRMDLLVGAGRHHRPASWRERSRGDRHCRRKTGERPLPLVVRQPASDVTEKKIIALVAARSRSGMSPVTRFKNVSGLWMPSSAPASARSTRRSCACCANRRQTPAAADSHAKAGCRRADFSALALPHRLAGVLAQRTQQIVDNPPFPGLDLCAQAHAGRQAHGDPSICRVALSSFTRTGKTGPSFRPASRRGRR